MDVVKNATQICLLPLLLLLVLLATMCEIILFNLEILHVETLLSLRMTDDWLPALPEFMEVLLSAVTD